MANSPYSRPDNKAARMCGQFIEEMLLHGMVGVDTPYIAHMMVMRMRQSQSLNPVFRVLEILATEHAEQEARRLLQGCQHCEEDDV